MIKIVALLSTIYQLSLGNRHLLQGGSPNTILPVPPPGHIYGAFDQLCPYPEAGAVICATPTDAVTASSDVVNCDRPNDCCLCSAITCGSDTAPCQRFTAGWIGAFGVQNINIIGGAIHCNGGQSCADTRIYGKAITQVSCNGKYSCQNAVIIIEDASAGFELNCARTRACDSLQIVLHFVATQADCVQSVEQFIRLGAVECVGVAACENLIFVINNERCDTAVIPMVECRDGSCEGAEFYFSGNVEIENCMLSAIGVQPLGLDQCYTNLQTLTCPYFGSCEDQVRSITNPVNGFILSCGGENSCANSVFVVYITATAPQYENEAVIVMNVNCEEVNSCQNANVVVNYIDATNTKRVEINIKCMAENACDNTMFSSGFGVSVESVLCQDPSFCTGCTFNGMPCHGNVPVLIQ